MEEFEAPKPILNLNNQNNIIILKSKEYKLNIDKEIYYLQLTLNSNDKMIYKINQENNNSFYYYKEFTYDELISILSLPVKYYDNISKIFQFYDTSISNNKVELIKSIINNKISMILLLKMTIGFDELESKIIINEIKEIINGENLNNEKINDKDEIEALKKKNEELESKIKMLMKKEEEMNEKINILIKDKKENDDFKNEIIKKINLLINENNKLKDNLNEIKNQKYKKIEEIKYEKKNEEK